MFRAPLRVELDPEGPERPMAPLNWSSPCSVHSPHSPSLSRAQRDPGSSKEKKTMKTTLFLLCFLSATLSFGQNSAGVSTLSNEPQMVSFYSHSRQELSRICPRNKICSRDPVSPMRRVNDRCGKLRQNRTQPLLVTLHVLCEKSTRPSRRPTSSGRTKPRRFEA